MELKLDGEKSSSKPEQPRRRRKWDVVSPSSITSSKPGSGVPSSSDTIENKKVKICDVSEEFGDAARARIDWSTSPDPSATDPLALETPIWHDDFLKAEIIINNSSGPKKSVLTRSSWQKEVGDQTNCSISTCGTYVPQGSYADSNASLLRLVISGPTKECIERAIERINAILKGDDPSGAMDNAAATARRARLPIASQEVYVNFKMPESFNLRGRLSGLNNTNFEYIEHESSCRIILRGKGSEIGNDEDYPDSSKALHILVSGRGNDICKFGTGLAQSLIDTVEKVAIRYLEIHPEELEQILPFDRPGRKRVSEMLGPSCATGANVHPPPPPILPQPQSQPQIPLPFPMAQVPLPGAMPISQGVQQPPFGFMMPQQQMMCGMMMMPGATGGAVLPSVPSINIAPDVKKPSDDTKQSDAD